jgi:hypothetical protein
VANVLIDFGAAVGLAIFLIMAVVPLFLDGWEWGERLPDGPEQDREPPLVSVTPLRVRAQPGPSGIDRHTAS